MPPAHAGRLKTIELELGWREDCRFASDNPSWEQINMVVADLTSAASAGQSFSSSVLMDVRVW